MSKREQRNEHRIHPVTGTCATLRPTPSQSNRVYALLNIQAKSALEADGKGKGWEEGEERDDYVRVDEEG